MTLSFHGAARTVTGSKHLLQLNNGKKILLDCGMFQGMGKDTLALNRNFGFDAGSIDHVIISHAHIDHTGLLPLLVKQGYKGTIYCTDATADLMRIMLPDSAHIQEADALHVNKQYKGRHDKHPVQPLYTVEDALAVLPLIKTVPFDVGYKIDEAVTLRYTDCGHILGSAAIHLSIWEKGKLMQLSFSGDIGRQRDMLLHAPAPFPQADYIIMESTYGNSLHDPMKIAAENLLQQIQYTCLEKKGRLIMPAFSIGRTQELLYTLNQLELEGRLPHLNYYLDSPLSISATGIIKQHAECFNEAVQEVLKRDRDIFSFKGLQLIHTVDESIALNSIEEPCVIISASGMAEAGRVKHHIVHGIEDARNTILLTGYCEPHSLGGRLAAQPKQVSIYGRQYTVAAEIVLLHSLSAHGDYKDLCNWLSCQHPDKVKKLFLVHGEYEVQKAFRKRLIKGGFDNIEIPSLHQSIELQP